MSAAQLVEVEIDGGTLTVNKNLTIGQVRRMSEAGNDLGAIIEVLASVIRSWPYDGDPSDPAAWDDLHMDEFNAVSEGVMEVLGNAQS